jgi:hypothetical protein
MELTPLHPDRRDNAEIPRRAAANLVSVDMGALSLLRAVAGHKALTNGENFCA